MAEKTTTIYSDELIKHATSVGLHYGFRPIERLAALDEVTTQTRKVHVPRSSLDPHNQELHHALHTYMEQGLDALSKPVLFYRSNIEYKKPTKDDPVYLGFQAIGSQKSISEALVIKAGLDVLKDLKKDDIAIHVNTIGDKDSVNRYQRELGAFFRKYISDVPPAAQALLRKDPLQCLRYLQKKQHELYDNAPGSMEYLTESSRKHLREILEYLETTDIPYIIDKSLVGTSDYRPETIYEIRSLAEEDLDPGEDTDPVVYARGCRYDDLSRKMFRTLVPAAGIVFEAQKRGVHKPADLNPKRLRQPKVHFIQFGFDAKLRSLSVIEVLRNSNIPVHQSLGNDRLTKQLEEAEKNGVPYTIIMGQKEVLDGTVIIRNMETRGQHIVPIGELPSFIKSLKF